jgi:hypothetical protein
VPDRCRISSRIPNKDAKKANTTYLLKRYRMSNLAILKSMKYELALKIAPKNCLKKAKLKALGLSRNAINVARIKTDRPLMSHAGSINFEFLSKKIL